MTFQSVLELSVVSANQDPTSGTWEVAALDSTYRVREWTWGERRRVIVDSVFATADGPTLDRAAFVERFVELVIDPVPETERRELLAAVGLRLMGVNPEKFPATLLDAEALLAREWTWGPAELDGQPAARLDEHVARLVPSTGHVIEPWNSVLVDDD